MNRELKPCVITDRTGRAVKAGDIMRHDRYGNHIRNLRDRCGAWGGPRQTDHKRWLTEALAERFLVTALGHNGYCPCINYEIIGKPGATGGAMASILELVPQGEA